ncbi:MAG: hypothetical protein PHN47_02225 [Clostridia bacterium]|nr:hypothetical protein [Clostridia bacterium]MDD4571295.1 hypothetical protein [Clostridia bacterium]
MLLACLGFALLFFTACANEQPHQQYLQAYQQLKEADSFIVENKSFLTTLMNLIDSVDETHMTETLTWKVIYKDNKVMAIVDSVVKDNKEAQAYITKWYFRDG